MSNDVKPRMLPLSELRPTTRRLILARGLRSFGQGALVVDFALHLDALGWSGVAIGVFLRAAGWSGGFLSLLTGVLSDRVRAELELDRRVPRENISVETGPQSVTLRGIVPMLQHQRRAEQDALNGVGVPSVTHRLEVEVQGREDGFQYRKNLRREGTVPWFRCSTRFQDGTFPWPRSP
jgi:hypothetical protein